MSAVVISGDTSGTVTLAAPAVAGSTTITLPSTTGTMALTTNPTLVSLGTITTTSGTSQSLSSLDLTPYKQVVLVYNGVQAGTSIQSIMSAAVTGSINTSNGVYGQCVIDLTSGAGTAIIEVSAGAAPSSKTGVSAYLIRTSLSTASTTITVSAGSTFTAGSVLVYGVR